mmetsp:Transcript_80915/g.187922  ORF Transcript_80915/g.187922 Transcript_80915/m.187922 type:complete len:306 (+) Transcript_80915:628-1545(+)
MHAELAVVEEDTQLGLWMNPQQWPELVREEDAVRVDLHRPVVQLEARFTDDLRPHSDEDVQVQGSAELSPLAAFEVAVHDKRHQAVVHLDDAVAVDSALVAGEEAHAFSVLHSQKVLLVGVRHHEREAIERACRVELLRRLPSRHSHYPLLVHAVCVAGVHGDQAAVYVLLHSVEADSAPDLDDAHVVVKHPLLAPVAGVARVHLQSRQGLVSMHGVQAEAIPVLYLARLLSVCPLLIDVTLGACGHGNQRSIGLEAEPVPDLYVALQEGGAVLELREAGGASAHACDHAVSRVLLHLLACPRGL